MKTITHLEDLRVPLLHARECLIILLANAPQALADISVTEVRPTESELPENNLLGWVNAGEVIFKTLTYLSCAQDEVDGAERYIDELLAKASGKPVVSSSSPTRRTTVPAEKQPDSPQNAHKNSQPGAAHDIDTSDNDHASGTYATSSAPQEAGAA